jgi:hypothetical protein
MRNPALRKYIDRVWPIRGIENSLQKGVENSENKSRHALQLLLIWH